MGDPICSTKTHQSLYQDMFMSTVIFATGMLLATVSATGSTASGSTSTSNADGNFQANCNRQYSQQYPRPQALRLCNGCFGYNKLSPNTEKCKHCVEADRAGRRRRLAATITEAIMNKIGTSELEF